MRSRNPRDLAADVEVGVLSASLCHVANISYRLGRETPLGSSEDPWTRQRPPDFLSTGSLGRGGHSLARHSSENSHTRARARHAKLRMNRIQSWSVQTTPQRPQLLTGPQRR